MSTQVKLSDEELVVLDGRCSDKVQVEVQAAKNRIEARATLDLSPELAGFVADAVTEATTNGQLMWQHKMIRSCDYCDKQGGYYRYKKGRQAGRPNYNRPNKYRGIELAYRFVTMESFVTLGGCTDCMEGVAPVLKEALRGVPAQVPANLRADGEPQRVKHPNVKCSKCNWEGHEGQMGRSRTIMGDGTYPSTCPNCGAMNTFGRVEVKGADGFQVVEKVSA